MDAVPLSRRSKEINVNMHCWRDVAFPEFRLPVWGENVIKNLQPLSLEMG